MKKRMMMCLLLVSSVALANGTPAASYEELPVISEHAEKIILSTQNIPERVSVLVACNVKLPHLYKTRFSFLVVPQTGEIGEVQAYTSITQSGGSCTEGTCSDVTTNFVRYIGSKIYTRSYQQSTIFNITQVKRSNEAIVFDLSSMPGGTTVSCAF